MTKAKEFLQTARDLWDTWDEGAIVADQATGQFLSDSTQGRFSHHGAQFDICRVTSGFPRSPQGHRGSSSKPATPIRVGSLRRGRRRLHLHPATAAHLRPVNASTPDGQGSVGSLRARRGRDSRSCLPATFVLGDTEEGGASNSPCNRRRQQVSGPTAILFLEQVWNRDLSNLPTPTVPCPMLSPTSESSSISKGRVTAFDDRTKTAARSRQHG